MVRRACESSVFSGACLRFVLGLSVLCALAACNKPRPNPNAKPLLPQLDAASWLVELDVAGFGKAALAVPLGATTARPIVIALHGVADRPEWACAALRAIAGPAPFVLCPRGVRRADIAAPDVRYTFGSADDAARELRAALTALKQRYGAYVAPGPVVFSGFEIGADHVAWIAREEPAFFSRLLLIAPAASSWSSSQAALFGRGGGQRVLFAFGPGQQNEFQLKALLTVRGGAEARTAFLGDRPPTLDAASVVALAKQWRWLAAPPSKPPTIENLAGNALPANGPTVGRPAH